MTTESAVRERLKQIMRDVELNPRMVDCPRCNGYGYHHGFGEHGHDPDWCEMCGGAQYVQDENQTADAILTAFPEITLAPGKDVAEGAQRIALRKWCGRFIGLTESKELEADIAAFAATHAAREREACAMIAETIWEHRDAHPTSLMAECGREVAAAIRAGESK